MTEPLLREVTVTDEPEKSEVSSSELSVEETANENSSAFRVEVVRLDTDGVTRVMEKDTVE